MSAGIIDFGYFHSTFIFNKNAIGVSLGNIFFNIHSLDYYNSSITDPVRRAVLGFAGAHGHLELKGPF